MTNTAKTNPYGTCPIWRHGDCDIAQGVHVQPGEATTPRTIDLDTAEGVAEWAKSLPTANLQSIAAREVFYGPVSNVLLVTAAQMELALRSAA